MEYYIFNSIHKEVLFDSFGSSRSALLFLRKYNLLLRRNDRLTPKKGICIISAEELQKQNIKPQQFLFDAATGTITGYKGSGKVNTLSIPNTIDGVVVRAIGDNAFVGLGITNVLLSTSVERIGQASFKDNALSYISLSGIKYIGVDAFAGNNITHIAIGANVDIASPSAMGKFGEAFVKLYCEVNKGGNGRFAGFYNYVDDSWTN